MMFVIEYSLGVGHMGLVYLFVFFIVVGVIAIVYGYVSTLEQHHDKERSWHAIWWISWGTLVITGVGVMALINSVIL